MRLAKLFSFFLLVFLFSLCSTPSDKNKENDLLILGIILFQNDSVYEFASCQTSYQLNQVYVSGGFAERFITDLKPYKNVFLGDSTASFYSEFPNFIDPKTTQNNATPGDTLCDYRSRFKKSIRSIPENIVISTAGGNDILKKVSNALIIETFVDFHNSLKSHFPHSKITYVEVHRTFVDYANAERKSIAYQMRAHSPDACWIDPDPCFSNPLLASEMLDTIHPNQGPAFCIKNLIWNQCGVLL
ncbi:SGNH/GDSL hydrolase family protein [Leptospira bouyouniensis]|uniref:SGNH/GDSL hydrolase family protein n=1 Tax=Leptospira bouyouniensis TaxID=2484911 RepID=A0A7I0IPI0_9LEPT|nr:SGNH/GDSL hydrolase family protein [Leptospira bouyouniensis]TGL06480.1 SGNH/GDSL hydrolase family protein [Leptospira bouyouniensis]